MTKGSYSTGFVAAILLALSGCSGRDAATDDTTVPALGRTGRMFAATDPPGQASTPSPTSGLTGVSIDPLLTWTAGTDATKHEVWLGTDPNAMTSTGDMANPTYRPSTLAENTKYYWRVDEKNANGSTRGPEPPWEFTTGTLPGQALSPTPADGAIDVDVTAKLKVVAGSSDVVRHLLYYGVDRENLKSWGSQGNNEWQPTDLQGGTQYFWRVDEGNNVGITPGTLWSFTTAAPVAPGKATLTYTSSVANGARDVNLVTTLTWNAGFPAPRTHEVFFGESEDSLVSKGEVTETKYSPPALNGDKDYYWRIDEKNEAGTTTGDVWTFRTGTSVLPDQASGPSPASGATEVDVAPTLTWKVGSGVKRQTVYFGQSETALEQVTTDYAGTMTSYSPSTLTPGRYCWRIDGDNTAGTRAGTVWCFTTKVPVLQPVAPKIARCVQERLNDTEGGGVGHSPGLRKLSVEFAYATRAQADDARQADVVAATKRIELCIVDSTGTATCKASSDAKWLIYDSTSKKDDYPPTASTLLRANDDRTPAGIKLLSFEVPGIDYADVANRGKFVILKVNGESSDEARKANGTCPLPYLMHNTTHFQAYGTESSVTDPWSGKGFGSACSGGALYRNVNQCISTGAAQNMLAEFEGVTAVHQSRLGVPADKQTWRNGTIDSVCGGTCKGYVWVYPGAPEGWTGVNLGPGRTIIDSNLAFSLSNWAAATPLGTIAHEMFHAVQGLYPAEMHTGFFEGSPNSVENNTCITTLSGLPNRCIAAGQLGLAGEGGSSLEHPEINVLALPYESGIYWRYFMEQYGLPVSTGYARPAGGQPSSITSNPTLPLGNTARSPDEGVDLLRLVLEKLAAAAASESGQPPLIRLTNELVSEKMKRSLGNLLLDLHTAQLLKDYRGMPPEWRFDWVGDFNAGASGPLFSGAPSPAQPIEDLKPFALPSSPRHDKLKRAHRIVDRVDVGPTDTVANTIEQVIDAYGAAYLSVLPTASDSTVTVRLRAGHCGAPRFRIFTVDPAGKGTLLSQCAKETGSGADSMRVCPGDSQGNVTVDIATGSGSSAVAEILVVASSPGQPVSFFYQIGAGSPTVQILSPNGGQPAVAGSPNPGGTARPFLVQVAVRDSDGKAVAGLSSDRIRLSTVNGGSTKVLTDVRLLPLSGGVYFVRATLAQGDLPAASATMDLKAEYLDQNKTAVLASDTNTGVLQVTGSPLPVATELLIDLSDSMNMDGRKKLNAVKQAAKFLLDTIPDGDDVGVMTYNHDANNWSPLGPLDSTRRGQLQAGIDALTAGGCTSLGDPLLEAQSLFNQRYSGSSTILNMLMLTDGINTANYAASYYYASNAPQLPKQQDGEGTPKCGISDPNPDDTNDWPAGSLKWHDQALKPKVTAIAFGQDASITELTNLASSTKGLFVYADEGGVGQVAQGAQELADAFRQGYNLAAQKSRIGTARVGSESELPSFLVEQGAQHLQVSLLTTASTPSGYLGLIAPDGTWHSPSHHSTHSTVYRVDSPMPGTWTWNVLYTPTPSPTPTIFVEEAVTSPLVLLAVADVEHAVSSGYETDDERWVGKDVFIQAVPTDGGDLLGITVTGTLTDPTGAVSNLTLLDDGQQGDGAANDGIYGTILRSPSVAGAYTVKLLASGTSTKVGEFTRHTTVGFSLHDAPDTDGDTVPDYVDPNPSLADEGEDPDHDGVTNAQEFTLGTNPLVSDSDDGGEDDGAEVAAGRDPRDRRDDDQAARAYMIHVSACHGKVLITPEIPITGQVEIEVSSQGLLGPYATVYAGGASASFTIDAPYGDERCYRMRTVAPISRSWSPPSCITTSTASADPQPPLIVSFMLADGTAWTHSRRVALDVVAIDGKVPSSALPRCAEVQESGVTDMMVSFAADFAGAVWQPYTSRVQVNLPSTGNVIDIWVKVRDGAGNESNSKHLTLRFSPAISSGFLLYGTNSVRLEDGVTLVGATGGPGALASEGPTTTEIGGKGSTGDVVSKGPILLRAEGTVYGNVETAQTLTQQSGATVHGAVSEHATVTLPGLPAFTIWPGTGTAVNLEPNQIRTLTPGNYGDLTLKRGSKLTIQSGTYRFKTVQIETDAQLILNRTSGALRIHMASLTHRGRVIEKAGAHGQTLFAVAGTNDVFIEGPFIGTLRAPNAQATIGTGVAQVHYGAFQAKSLLVRSKSTLYHLPWTY